MARLCTSDFAQGNVTEETTEGVLRGRDIGKSDFRSSESKRLNTYFEVGVVVAIAVIRVDPRKLSPLLLVRPAAPSHAQMSPDERLQIAVEHPVHIADLSLGAMVLDHSIGL